MPSLMKRLDRIVALLGLVAVLTSVTFLLAGEPGKPAHPKTSAPCCQAKAASTCSSAATTDEHIVQELVTILKETRSPDTLLVTVTVLGRMGPAAKPAIPVIIRSADRLELLKDISNPEATGRKEELAEILMDSIDRILQKPGSGRPKTARVPRPDQLIYPPAAPACAPCPPTYAPPPAYISREPQPPQPAPAPGVYEAVPVPTEAPAPPPTLVPPPAPTPPRPAPSKPSRPRVSSPSYAP